MGRRHLAALAALLAVAAAPPALAAPGEADYATLNAALARHHAAPRYARFADAAGRFDVAVRKACTGAAIDKDALTGAYHAAMDAWMGIEHIRFGPIETLMRNYRIHYWPDKGGRGEKQIRILLNSGDAQAFSREGFQAASVAVQGLPAAERLLFGPAMARIADKADDGRACRFLSAVSANLLDLGAGLAVDWAADSPFVVSLGRAGEGALHENHKAVTAEFLKSMNTSMQVIVDLKLDRPLGKGADGARPKEAESWRSRRSLANVAANLDALREMYEGAAGTPGLKSLAGADQAATAKLSAAFAQTAATARAIAMPLFEAVSDPMARPKVERLALQARALKALVTGTLAPAIGIRLGFNALDGD